MVIHTVLSHDDTIAVRVKRPTIRDVYMCLYKYIDFKRKKLEKPKNGVNLPRSYQLAFH